MSLCGSALSHFVLIMFEKDKSPLLEALDLSPLGFNPLIFNISKIQRLEAYLATLYQNHQVSFDKSISSRSLYFFITLVYTLVDKSERTVHLQVAWMAYNDYLKMDKYLLIICGLTGEKCINNLSWIKTKVCFAVGY